MPSSLTFLPVIISQIEFSFKGMTDKSFHSGLVFSKICKGLLSFFSKLFVIERNLRPFQVQDYFQLLLGIS